MEVIPSLERFKLTDARAPFKIAIPTSKGDQDSLNISVSAERHESGDFYKLDVGEGKPYSSVEYNETVSKRPSRIKHFLDLDCSVLYDDVDTAWLKSPFDAIRSAGSYEMYVTDDSRQGWGLYSDVLCSCFLYVHPTMNAWVVITDWAALMAEEPGVNEAKFNQAFRTRLEYSPGFAVALPQSEFPNGMDPIPKSPTEVHANGHSEDEKEKYLRDHGAWSLD